VFNISSRYLEENFFVRLNRDNKQYRKINFTNFNTLNWIRGIYNNTLFDTFERDVEINVLRDLTEGRAFTHWLNYKISKKAIDENCNLDYKDYYQKNLIYFNFINMLVEDIAMQCPVMENFDPRQDLNDKEIKYLKEELENLDWVQTSIDIVKELELKGDSFYQIYYDSTEKKHKFTKLKSENMIDIIVDKDDIKYIYRNKRIVKALDLEKSTYIRKDVEDIIIFTNGYYVEYLDVTNLDITNAESKNIVYNTKEMGDMLPIIHIRGKEKREDSEFSKIPSVDYIDPNLDTNTVITDVRTSNRNAGSPRYVVINGELDLDKSVLDAGGLIHIDTPDRLKEFSSKNLPETNVKSFEITNSLSSLNKELTMYLDFLYRIVGLIPPTLQEKMSSSDSSKAIAQFRTKQEVKNKFYMTSIKKAFSEFFALILKDLNKKSKKEKVFLQIPKILVTSSIYDNLLLVAQEMSLGISTLKDYLKEQGYSEKQIKDIMDNQKEVLENSVIEKNTENNTKDNTDDVLKNSKVDTDDSTKVDNKMKQSNKKG
jgi:hypothetical protein